ncbi:Carbonic AnHydrase [Chamberlinius hualienensis]
MSIISLTFFLVILTIIKFDDVRSTICVAEWHYWGWNGQEHWCCRGFHLCCGEHQSPINIDIRHATYHKDADCLGLHNYEIPPRALALHNNGHHVELIHNSWNSTSNPHVTEGTIRDGVRYELDRIIWHWGNTSQRGSEHTLDNIEMPMEMQLIHRNTKYSTMEEAMNKTDGLLILSVLYVVVPHDNNNYREVVYNLKDVIWKDSWKCVKPFPLLNLLPPSFGYYYTYRGSLPFPPCFESATWIVFHNPVYISEYQLNEFRAIQDETEDICPDYSCPMYNNFRKPNCIRDRKVKWKEECSPDPRC